jgi:uncharacterized iron-regulated membrane protein
VPAGPSQGKQGRSNAYAARVRLVGMKASRLNRIVHRWGAILTAVPVLIVLVSGLILQLKKQSEWIQPKTQAGSQSPPGLSFPKILTIAKTVPEAEVRSWDDVDRLDVRPGKGILKVRCKNRWEVQIDAATGEVLHVAFRRSDLIESIHDGSFFSDTIKQGVFLPSAIILIGLWVTGIYLFFLPILARRKNRVRRKPAPG